MVAKYETKGSSSLPKKTYRVLAIAGEIDKLRGSVQEGNFIQGETEENVEGWSEAIHADLWIPPFESIAAVIKGIASETRDNKR